MSDRERRSRSRKRRDQSASIPPRSGSSRPSGSKHRPKERSKSSRRRDAPDDGELPTNPADETSPNHPLHPFRNYSYPNDKGFLRILLLFLELLAVVLLFVLCFAPANMSGGSVSVLRDTQGKEYVGVLRKCSDSTCDPWLGGSSSASSATAPTRRSSDPIPSRHPFFPLLSIRSVHSMYTRAGSSDPDLPTMYLTTGLATLSALWILIYLVGQTFIRFACLSTPPQTDTTGLTETMKRFIYRSTRIWLVALCILLGAILLDVGVKGAQYRSAKGLTGINGVGPGIAIILFAWLCCIICALIELGGDRIHRFFNSLSCGSQWGCCEMFGRENRGVNTLDDRSIEMAERGESRTQAETGKSKTF